VVKDFGYALAVGLPGAWLVQHLLLQRHKRLRTAIEAISAKEQTQDRSEEFLQIIDQHEAGDGQGDSNDAREERKPDQVSPEDHVSRPEGCHWHEGDTRDDRNVEGQVEDDVSCVSPWIPSRGELDYDNRDQRREVHSPKRVP